MQHNSQKIFYMEYLFINFHNKQLKLRKEKLPQENPAAIMHNIGFRSPLIREFP